MECFLLPSISDTILDILPPLLLFCITTLCSTLHPFLQITNYSCHGHDQGNLASFLRLTDSLEPWEYHHYNVLTYSYQHHNSLQSINKKNREEPTGQFCWNPTWNSLISIWGKKIDSSQQHPTKVDIRFYFWNLCESLPCCQDTLS